MLEYLKPLTSLRFFAAAWVILYSYWPGLQGSVPIGIIGKGYLGVELFFILSGFILCHVYLNDFGTGKFQYGQFITNRLARIYPLHIATLLFTMALVGAAAMKGIALDSNVASWDSIPAQLLMMHAWGLAPQAAWNHPSWSISAEWFAYLAFPAFAVLAWALRARPATAVSLSAAFLVILYAVFEAIAGFKLTEATIFWGALRIVPCFALGCALYLAWQSGGVKQPAVALSGTVTSLTVIAVAASLNLPDSVIVLALGGLILSVSGLAKDQTRDSGKSVMSHPILVYLGNVSFAMYMVYVPWKWIFTKAAGMALGIDGPLPLLWWAIGFIGIIPVAMVAHHAVETPMRHIIRALSDQMRARFKPASAK